jgi:small subunit ribosomal protein S6
LNIYEVMFLITPDLDKEALKAQQKAIEDMAVKYNGHIESAQELGKRPLAYNIKKHKEGVYYLFNIKMDAAQVKAFQDELKLNEMILRMVFNKLSENPQTEKSAL